MIWLIKYHKRLKNARPQGERYKPEGQYVPFRTCGSSEAWPQRSYCGLWPKDWMASCSRTSISAPLTLGYVTKTVWISTGSPFGRRGDCTGLAVQTTPDVGPPSVSNPSSSS